MKTTAEIQQILDELELQDQALSEFEYFFKFGEWPERSYTLIAE